ncbi:MAG: phosphatase PAP2 family protein [Actinomycetota bacterium]|nr:phosphatase PAP2 family protein [Actinomycetota bacterium]
MSSGTLIGPLRERAYDDPAPGVRLEGWRRFVSLRNRVRPHVLGELLVLTFLLYLYNVIRSHAAVRRDLAMHNAHVLLALEHHLGLAWEKSTNVWVSAHPLLANAISYYYQYSHISVTLAVLVVCYWRAPNIYRPLRNALLFTNLLGLVVYAFYPLAPPRLIPGAGYVDSVSQAGFGTTHGGPVLADQFGAMPSLHLAWATWVAISVFCLTHRRWVRALALLNLTVMTVTVVVTANHYVLDVVAGVAAAYLGIWVARTHMWRRDQRLLDRVSRAGQPDDEPVSLVRGRIGAHDQD